MRKNDIGHSDHKKPDQKYDPSRGAYQQHSVLNNTQNARDPKDSESISKKGAGDSSPLCEICMQMYNANEGLDRPNCKHLPQKLSSTIKGNPKIQGNMDISRSVSIQQSNLAKQEYQFDIFQSFSQQIALKITRKSKYLQNQFQLSSSKFDKPSQLASKQTQAMPSGAGLPPKNAQGASALEDTLDINKPVHHRQPKPNPVFNKQDTDLMSIVDEDNGRWEREQTANRQLNPQQHPGNLPQNRGSAKVSYEPPASSNHAKNRISGGYPKEQIEQFLKKPNNASFTYLDEQNQEPKLAVPGGAVGGAVNLPWNVTKPSSFAIPGQGRRFGLVNKDGQFNCFINLDQTKPNILFSLIIKNVCLQLIWHQDHLRKALIEFAKQKQREYSVYESQLETPGGPIRGGAQINPNKHFPEYSFIKAFVNFIAQAQDESIQIVNANIEIRRELFKLFYMEQTFDLSDKGDAQEALMRIYQLIHSCFITSEEKKILIKNFSHGGANAKTLERQLERYKCTDQCFVHKISAFQLKTEAICDFCKVSIEKERTDYNQFMHVINATEYLTFLNHYKSSNQNYLDFYFAAIKSQNRIQKTNVQCQTELCKRYGTCVIIFCSNKIEFCGKGSPKYPHSEFQLEYLRRRRRQINGYSVLLHVYCRQAYYCSDV